MRAAADVSARVAVEAGSPPWHKFVGDTGEIVSIERFGESADDKTLFREFGFTPVPWWPRRNAHWTTETQRSWYDPEPNLAALSAAGVSVWLDDLSRDRLQSGNLSELIDTRSVVGVTTNPSIFQAALAKGTPTTRRWPNCRARGRRRRHDPHRHHRRRTEARRAASAGGGLRRRRRPGVHRGRPRLAHDTDKTILQAIELWKIVDRPNLLIKIPATRLACCPPSPRSSRRAFRSTSR
jgi:hypothetical protein